MTKNFSEIFKELNKDINIKIGEILTGTIICIYKDFVLVDVGLKSESYVSIEEFINEEKNIDIKVGDKIDFVLESIENGYGETVISRNKAKQYESWTELEEFYINNKSIVGLVVEKIKGGFAVEINNIRAFLPGSLVDFKSIKDSYNLEGRELNLKIIKIDKKKNNIIVSRKIISELESNDEKKKIISKLKENDIIKGTIKNITNYGIFMDLGGIDGLLHITDITWKRIKHPSEIFKIGDKIDVKILKFDMSKYRVSLGLKQLIEDPWFSIYKKYPKGLIISGKVTNITDYGCFVEIENGIEGLVHVSEMDWKNKNANPLKIVNLNDNVNVMILDVDLDKKRISLGIKQCKENPWKEFSDNYKSGNIIKGYIKSITDFGIFVELNDNIDGLIHLTDISWLIDKSKDLDKFSKGNEITTIILNIDLDKNRISLGIKQLSEDPFEKYILLNKKGSIVDGKIIDYKNDILIISITDYIIGNIKLDLQKENENKEKIKINDRILSKIINFDKKNRVINLIFYTKNDNLEIDSKDVIDKCIINNFTNTMIEAFKAAKNK